MSTLTGRDLKFQVPVFLFLVRDRTKSSRGQTQRSVLSFVLINSVRFAIKFERVGTKSKFSRLKNFIGETFEPETFQVFQCTKILCRGKF